MIKRHPELFISTDVRPSDYNIHKYCAGDCTTRAITYCLNGKMNYNQVEDLQYKLAEKYGTHRNTNGTWDKILIDNGYVWLNFSKKLVRSKLCLALAEIKSPMVSHSTGHVAVIHEGKVRDSWDSTGGKVDNLLVLKEDSKKIIDALEIYGIYAEENFKCKIIQKHHKNRLMWRYAAA